MCIFIYITATVKVQDRVLEALEKKHSSELSILMKLSADADDLDNVEQGLYINNVVCCVTLYKLSFFVGMKTLELKSGTGTETHARLICSNR